MSSYASIRSELLQIDQMILQAQAARLIASIHHDLVRREGLLFAKVAKLDADSLMQWRRDSRFFHDVMQEIDLVNSSQIDEDTLYKRIPELKRKADKATAAAAAAAVSAATSSAAAAISAALSVTQPPPPSKITSSGTHANTLSRLSGLSLSPSAKPTKVEETATCHSLQSIRVSEHHGQILPSSSCTSSTSARISPIPAERRAILVLDSDEEDDEEVEGVLSHRRPSVGTKNNQQSTFNASVKKLVKTKVEVNLVSRATQNISPPTSTQKKRQHTAVEEVDSDDEPLLATPKKIRTKPIGKQISEEKRHRTDKEKKAATDEEEYELDSDSTQASEGNMKPKLQQPRNQHRHTNNKQFYSQPCSNCAKRKVPCELPVGGRGRSCKLCKASKIKCQHAHSKDSGFQNPKLTEHWTPLGA